MRPEYREKFDGLPEEYSHLYLAVDQELAAVICIEDPLREEAADIVRELKKAGIENVVMMTGDSERTAAAIARNVLAIEEYYFRSTCRKRRLDFIDEREGSGT